MFLFLTLHKFVAFFTNQMKTLATLVSILFIHVLGMTAQNRFVSVVTNFTEKDYNGALQNWCVSQDEGGVVYIGNNEGLLSFDGFFWTHTPMPRGTIIRSVFVDKERIYAGSFEDFGYFEKDPLGRLNYHSLSSSLPSESLRDEEYWNIIPLGDDIVFQSFQHLYRYDRKNNKIEVIRAVIEDGHPNDEFHSLYLFQINGKLYAQKTLGNFYTLESNIWKPVWPLESYGSHIVGYSLPLSYNPLSSSIPDNTLIFTEDNLIFRVKDGRLENFKTEADNDIRSYRINRVTDGKNGTIFIGTIGNGVFHIDRKGNLISHYSTRSGLNNNTVLGLLNDKDGNLWVALDDGVSLIHTGLPVKVLYPDSNDPYLGMGYDIGIHDGHLVVATNQGAYTYEEHFSLVPQSIGQNWFVETFESQCFIGGNNQTLIMDAYHNSTSSVNVSGTDIKKGEIGGKDVLIQSSYYPMVYYLKDMEGKWRYQGIIEGVDTPIRQFEFDHDGNLWCSHWTNGVLKMRVADDFSRVTDKKYYPNVDNDSIPKKCFVVKIRGKIYFSQNGILYSYNETSDSFENETKLTEEMLSLGLIKHVARSNGNKFWIASPSYYSLMHYDNGYHLDYAIPLSLFNRINNGENFSIHQQDSVAYFTLNEALGMVELNKIENRPRTSSLSFFQLSNVDSNGNTVYLPLDSDSKTKLDNGNLRVYLSYPNYDNQPLRYRFILEGNGESKDTVNTEPLMYYPVINPGNYVLKCIVEELDGEQLDAISYDFRVNTPWFLRWWAWIIYGLILASTVYIVSNLRAKRILRRQQQKFAEDKARQEARIQEQALVIAHQEKKILESQLSSKSKELASMALGAYARQQVVENMKASLADKRKKGANTKEAERVLHAISGDERDDTMFWDTFEKNFDLIHENFFRNLRREFPSLTPSDLKFCALLRMNMSTKEISRFTNLTVRGVETARYRIRKKFNLDSQKSIVEFLIEFNSENTSPSPDINPSEEEQ